jgi:glycosyltransferase involved in cell wall biosynthesis
MSEIAHEKNVSCILLTLNEESAISKVVGDIRRALPECEIVVVDSSTDRTAEIAEKLGCKVIRQLPPKGYGWAMDAGFKNASGEYIVTLDCDDTYPTEVLPELVRRLDTGADLVSCSRMEKRPQAMKFSHYLANRTFAIAACFVCGARTTDVHTGMRAYRKSMLEALPIEPEGMALPVELQIAPQRLGFNCQEFFIEYRPRIGDSKIVPVEGTIWTFRRIWRWRRFFNPRHAQSTLVSMSLLFPLALLLPNQPAFSQTKPEIKQSKKVAVQSPALYGGGLLMRVKMLNTEGPAALELDTLKADKITVPASQFEIPRGFKEAVSAKEIMLGSGADGLKDFLP